MYKEIFKDYLSVETVHTKAEPERTGKRRFFDKWRG